jgi:hypothetical protein
MDVYHIWCDLHPGTSDVEFADAVQAYLGRLQDEGWVAGHCRTRGSERF